MKLEEVSLQVNVELDMVGDGSIKKSFQDIVGNGVSEKQLLLERGKR